MLYTLVDQNLRGGIDERCAPMGLPCVSVLEPVLTVFQSYLGTPAGRRVGAQHVLDAEYFRRIDALNFTMEHDDGQLAGRLEEADVVLVGISRTSKTPTSIYLANRGIKTANIPIVLGVPVPRKPVQRRRAAGRRPDRHAERIVQSARTACWPLKRTRRRDRYVDRDAVIAEDSPMRRQSVRRHGWPMIDVTRRSIEETAAAIMALPCERPSAHGRPSKERRHGRDDHPRFGQPVPQGAAGECRHRVRGGAGRRSTSARSKRRAWRRRRRPTIAAGRLPKPRRRGRRAQSRRAGASAPTRRCRSTTMRSSTSRPTWRRAPRSCWRCRERPTSCIRAAVLARATASVVWQHVEQRRL